MACSVSLAEHGSIRGEPPLGLTKLYGGIGHTMDITRDVSVESPCGTVLPRIVSPIILNLEVLGSQVATDGGCELDMIQRMNEEYQASEC